MTEFLLTIESVMTRKHFEKAKVVAGHGNLQRYVKWVHILESLDIEPFVKGGELILTTGIPIARGEEVFIDFIKKLSQLDAAGLCVELGKHIERIPDSVIQCANALAFPIVTFTNVVPFVEITQDLHKLLINQQYELLQHLESYAQDLHKLALYATNYEQLLMRMHKYLNVFIAFELKGEDILYIPNTQQALFHHLRQTAPSDTEHFLSKDIYLLQQKYGTIYIYSVNRILTELDTLILDRTSVALANYLLRDLYIDEKQGNENRLILTQWLHNELTVQDIQLFLEDYAPKTIKCSWIVMIQRITRFNKNQNLTYHKLFIHNILEKYGFFSCTVEENRELIFIIADIWGKNDYKQRLEAVVREMNEKSQEDMPNILGFGHYVNSLQDVFRSYETAKNTIFIRKHNKKLSYFFDDLPLQHMLLQLRKDKVFLDVARQYLSPLFEYDQQFNGQLVRTLTKYLEMNGLKKETAQELFIVRQTLYHRLEKIESIIGKDFMKGDQRLAIELMLRLIDE